MNTQNELLIEMFNKEITKLRQEFYDRNVTAMHSLHDSRDIEKAYKYFMAIPILNSLNLSSWSLFEECCKIAREHRENKEG